jgi:hypothetical protein
MYPLSYLLARERAADLRREASRAVGRGDPDRPRLRRPDRAATHARWWSR